MRVFLRSHFFRMASPVPSHSSKKLPQDDPQPRGSPYQYHVADGRLTIDGEDYGDAEEALAEGMRLVELTRVWGDVARA